MTSRTRSRHRASTVLAGATSTTTPMAEERPSGTRTPSRAAGGHPGRVGAEVPLRHAESMTGVVLLERLPERRVRDVLELAVEGRPDLVSGGADLGPVRLLHSVHLVREVPFYASYGLRVRELSRPRPAAR